MPCFLEQKEIVDWILRLTPVFISISVAIIGFLQYKTNKNKLRLDLYNRRFAVFDRMLVYYKAFYSSNLMPEKLRDIELDFVRAYRESSFLFGRESSVYKAMTEIKDGFRPLVYDGEEYSASSKIKEKNPDLEKLMKSLEDALIPWLDFQKMEK
jgi:hypothetical protein